MIARTNIRPGSTASLWPATPDHPQPWGRPRPTTARPLVDDFRLDGSPAGSDRGWTDRRVGRWLGAFLALGVVLRLARFGLGHPLWRDEAFLVANLIDRDLAGLARPLDFGQVCPLFFLWLEKAIMSVLGCSERWLRLVPTLASIAGLFLFRHLAGRLLRGEALVLAVAMLAVAFTPIRYGGEVKPYASDFLLALALIVLAVEWLRDRARVGFLWALVASGPLIIGLSNPAIFVVVGLVLVLAIPIGQTRSIRAIVPFGLFCGGSGAAFLLLYRLVNAPQGDHVMGWMQLYWAGAFPPRSLGPLLGWLIRTHSSQMFAYPFGGDHGLSVLTTGLVAAAVLAYIRRGPRIILALLLTPFGLGLAAAGLKLYPYGGSARTMQYVAPAILLMAGLGTAVGIARLPQPKWRDRASRLVLVALGVVGGGMLGWDVTHPFKALEDQATRDFARRFWAEESAGAELICARNDLKLALNPLIWENSRAAIYQCNRAIYSPRHRGRTPPWPKRIDASRPLRVVLFNPDRGDRATMDRWIEANRGRYHLRGRRERVLNPGQLRGKSLVEDRFVVYEFVPARSPVDPPVPRQVAQGGPISR